jgi:hypothetical protein
MKEARLILKEIGFLRLYVIPEEPSSIQSGNHSSNDNVITARL